MSLVKWVQHISGQGEKFEVSEDLDSVWRVRRNVGWDWWLPKSEYRLCDPPERRLWVNRMDCFKNQSDLLSVSMLKNPIGFNPMEVIEYCDHEQQVNCLRYRAECAEKALADLRADVARRKLDASQRAAVDEARALQNSTGPSRPIGNAGE